MVYRLHAYGEETLPNRHSERHIRTRRTPRWSYLRRTVQLSSLAAFLALTAAGVGSASRLLPDSFFARLDPLVALGTTVAARAFVPVTAVALVTVVATVLLGRVWCGWVCPVGTVLDLLPASDRRKSIPLPPSVRFGKYLTLGVILAAAVFGIVAPMAMDPVTIATRPLQELARPFVGADALGSTSGADIARASIPAVALLSLLPLYFVLGLNGVGRRLWCRSLCPLGGLLAAVSAAPGLRRVVNASRCTSCGRCERECATAAIDGEAAFASSRPECTMCMRCVDRCPASAISFRFEAPRLAAPYSPKRREAIAAIGATGASLAIAMLPVAASAEPVLRPPGTDEERLGRLCVRCGSCYSGCPTGSLRPSLSFTSRAGFWTPMLDERPAWCTLSCNRCAERCPTDALHTLTVDEQITQGVGTVASLDESRCRAYRGEQCMRCLPACPMHGAITAVPDPMRREGLRVPVLDTDRCVGCNLCAEACPVKMGGPAIGVPTGTPPSPDAGVLL